LPLLSRVGMALAVALAVVLVVALAVAVVLVVALAMEWTPLIRFIFKNDVADALSRLVEQVLNSLSLSVIKVGAI